MVFDRKSTPGYALGVASRSKRGVAEEDSFKSRDFLIIFCRESILRLCLTSILVTVVVAADVIALVMDYNGRSL